MSVLLMGASGSLGTSLVRRLLAESDEVRAIEGDEDAATRMKSLGVRVARGSDDDPDLIERAAQNVRTLVLVDPGSDALGAALEGAVAAGRDVRIVVCTPSPAAELVAALRASSMSYVLLVGGGARRRPWRRKVSEALVVEAVNAADDLAGSPRLEIELADEAALGVLGLKAARRRGT